MSIVVNCIICGKECKRPKSLLERNTKNYCSRDCYNFRNGI